MKIHILKTDKDRKEDLDLKRVLEFGDKSLIF